MTRSFVYVLYLACLSYFQTDAFLMPLHNNQPNLLRMNMQMDRRDMLGKVLLVASSPLVSGILKSANAFTGDEKNNIDMFEKLSPSVCYISTEYKNIAGKLDIDTSKIPKGVGTGFVWDREGHIITNFHVINKVDNATITLTNKDGVERDYIAKLTGVDADKDIAVLKVDVDPADGMQLLPISLANNKDIKIGQYAFAIGNPFGKDHSLSMGIISGKNREMKAPTGRKIREVIQTDAAVNPGNSGGPLVDYAGRLIGMNTATVGMGVSAGVGLAVSVDTIKQSVSNILEFGAVEKPALGISYLEQLPSRKEAEKSGIPYVDRGVIVLEVPETSPAYSAGLRGIRKKTILNDTDASTTAITDMNPITSTLGDVIVGINNYSVSDADDMLNALDQYKPNDKIKLFVLRGAERKGVILDVVLGSFELKTFSGLEAENPDKKPVKQGITIPLDIPLKDMAPQRKP